MKKEVLEIWLSGYKVIIFNGVIYDIMNEWST